ncbi:hypothetical protein EYF80_053478 [Liparis tanakae]|uniref:Uncharacterized protein n=1 Tax=Liparis tanakae TaxID=230148 RepID=A0A4Z2F6J0_9TELE|nr:hypothetical protein EYF80_053478 [Liparis tanakae]
MRERQREGEKMRERQREGEKMRERQREGGKDLHQGCSAPVRKPAERETASRGRLTRHGETEMTRCCCYLAL